MPRRGSPYGPEYQRERAVLLANGPRCVWCMVARATTADHVPSLAEHVHRNGTGCCRLVAACSPCNTKRGGWRLANELRRGRTLGRRIPPASRAW